MPIDEPPVIAIVRSVLADILGHGEDVLIPALDGDQWINVATQADEHVLALWVYNHFKEKNCLAPLPSEINERWEAESHHARLQHSLQTQDAHLITEALGAAGIRHAFIKGFAYRHLLYSPPWVRLGGDVDLLIDKGAVHRAREVMTRIGFVQAACNSSYQQYRKALPEEIQRVEENHYELGQFVRNYSLEGPHRWLLCPPFIQRVPFAYELLPSGPVFHSCVDIHWALDFTFLRARPLARLSTFLAEDRSGFPTLAPEWHLIHSIFKLYYEAFSRPGFGLTHLVDICLLLSSHADSIQWDVVDALSESYSLDAAAIFVLSAAVNLTTETLVPEHISRQWMCRLAENSFPPATNLGDFAPYLMLA